MAEFKLNYTGDQINQAVETANAALPKAGGTMSGPLTMESTLTLSGAPTNDNHAANKKYVDDKIGNISLTPGGNGASAYQIACDNGFKGSEAEWLESLKGKDGKYYIPSLSATGYLHFSPSDGEGNNITSSVCLKGRDGAPGDSAYQIACDNGFVGSEAEWLESLKGEKGDPGSGGGTADSVAWEDITGRPFGEPLTGTATIDGDTLSWYGNVADMPVVVEQNSQHSWTYVSDNIPTAAQLANGFKVFNDRSGWGSSDPVYEVTGIEITSDGENATVLGIPGDMDQVRIVKKPHDYGSGRFEHAGVYFWTWGTTMHTCELQINGYTWKRSKEIVKLPQGSIPELNELIMISPNGAKWRLSVGDDGTMQCNRVIE